MPTASSTAAWGGVASRAVDGSTNGAWDANSCTHSEGNGPHWWRVDLGRTVDVSAVQLWDRTDSCCNNRLNDFHVTVGNIKDDWSANPSCPNVPSSVGTSATIACPMRGRFVFVAMATDTLTLCEVRVFANKLLGSPSARYGHAAVTVRGSMVIFGGIAADDSALSDVHVFDTVALGFKTTLKLIGDTPQARVGAKLQQLARGNQLVLFGGRAAAAANSDPIADLRLLEMGACNDVDQTGVDSVNDFRGSRYYVCDGDQGFTERNPVQGDPVVCSPEG